jgi:5-hmdU DNA kinase-like protein
MMTNPIYDQVQRIRAFNAFVNERESIRMKKVAGEPRPWSDDPIFQQYKFCNVHREDDRTTQWIRANWRNPNIKDPDLWFAMVIARRAINWPPCLEALGYPLSADRQGGERWDPQDFLHVIKVRTAAGLKCYDTAYQLLVQGRKGDKATNMVDYILQPLWDAREEIRPRLHDTLRSFYERLSAFKYMGSFYTGQVVADLKYAQLMLADDWQTFAVPGPGSERGLNRVMGHDKNAPWREDNWQKNLADLHILTEMKMHAQDLQNCLCEFDKYERIRLGEGRVRPYKPTV